MENNIELVLKAQQGDKQALGQLAEWGRVCLHPYVSRLTLDEELTRDIVQESLTAMVRQIKSVKDPAHLGGWLRAVAFNLIRSHYRGNWARRSRPLPANVEDYPEEDHCGPVAKVVRRELEQSIMRAMHSLRPQYRAVLAMRCYDQLHYDEISSQLGCSNFAARALFCRAKKAMAKALAKNGLGKGALVMALTVFGKLTAPTEAAAAGLSINASLLQAGFLASLAALSRTALLGLGLCCAAGVGTAGLLVSVNQDDTIRYVQGQDAQQIRQTESWFSFPLNARGVVHTQTKTRFQDNGPACVVLQNDHGNYVRQGNTVTIHNARAWNDDLAILRLPTDKPSFTRFLDRMEGRTSSLRYVPLSKQGLVVRVENQVNQDMKQQILPLDLSQEEFLQYGWPAHVDLVDQRDAMHKRGWTYFSVHGKLHDQEVAGRGRIPFVSSQSEAHSAWLRLTVGSACTLWDNGRRAGMIHHNNTGIRHFRGGSFLQGLSRPWLGIHSVDSIRRDAALYEHTSETTANVKQQTVSVSVQSGQQRLDYLIDMHQDLVREIRFFQGQDEVGELAFDYRQSVEENDTRFLAPKGKTRRPTRVHGTEDLWLFTIMEKRN